ncbi:MAG TPA: VanZ family protein [Candidatus Pullilachnospira intestinigallinarum]|nr:VanZ family protein [Candidatus Pullilachnospira intestinigallinarum]
MEIYREVIWQALVAFPLIAGMFTVPYMIYNYHKFGSVLSLRILIVYSFILYLLCAYYLVILPLPTRAEVAAMTGPRTQLVPFHFLQDILKESHASLTDPASWLTLVNQALFQVVFNVAMTVPFGVYLRYYFRCSLRKTILLSFLLSLFFELTQLSGLYFIYPRGYRLFDVDDLMANTLGGAVGYFAVAPFLKLLPAREKMDKTSFRRGQEISLGRRVMAFLLDIPIAGLLAVLGLTVIPWKGSYGMLLFLSYYILLPVFWRGLTVGKRIMRIRVVAENGQKALWNQILLRNICLWSLLYLTPQVIYHLGMDGEGTFRALFLYGLSYGGWCFMLFFELVGMARHRTLFYERISGTKEISVIEEKGKN